MEIIVGSLEETQRGNGRAAQELMKEAIAFLVSSPQPDDKTFAQCVYNIRDKVLVLDEKLGEQLVIRAANALSDPEDASEKIELLGKLAGHYAVLGNEDAAVEVMRQVVDIRDSLATANTKDKLLARLDLAKFQLNAGALTDAIDLFTAIRPAVIEEFGEVSEEQGDLLNHLSLALGKANKPNDALSAAQQAMEIFEELEGEYSLRSARILGLELPMIYRALGQEELREVVQRRAEAIYKSRSDFLFDSELDEAKVLLQWDYANLLSNLGSTLADRRRFSDALRHMNRSLAIKEVYGETPELIGILRKLAATAAQSGDFVEANRYAERMVRIARTDLGDAHPRTRDCLELHEMILSDLNRSA